MNFWIYIDTLNDQEKKEMGQRFLGLDVGVRYSAIVAARDAAAEVVCWNFSDKALYVTGCMVFGWATVELTVTHKLIKQGNPLTFLPLCIKS